MRGLAIQVAFFAGLFVLCMLTFVIVLYCTCQWFTLCM